jgi:hypothetical protein
LLPAGLIDISAATYPGDTGAQRKRAHCSDSNLISALELPLAVVATGGIWWFPLHNLAALLLTGKQHRNCSRLASGGTAAERSRAAEVCRRIVLQHRGVCGRRRRQRRILQYAFSYRRALRCRATPSEYKPEPVPCHGCHVLR